MHFGFSSEFSITFQRNFKAQFSFTVGADKFGKSENDSNNIQLYRHHVFVQRDISLTEIATRRDNILKLYQ